MKKYKLNIAVRKGFVDTHVQEIELDTLHSTEAFALKTLSTFKDDAYLVFSLEEVPEEGKQEAN